MKNNVKENPWINAIMASLLAIGIFYISSSMNFVVALVELVPFIILYVNDGWKFSLLSLALTFGASLLFMNPVDLSLRMSSIIILSIFIGEGIKRKKELKKIVLYSSFIKFTIFLAISLIYYFVADDNPVDLLRTYMNSLINDSIKTLSLDVNFQMEEMDAMIAGLRESIDMVIRVLPAFSYITAYLITAINTVLSIFVLKKVRDDVDYSLKFNKYRPTESYKMGSLTILASLVFLYLMKFKQIELLTWNVITVLAFFLAMDGLALMDYYYEKRIPKFFRLVFPVIFILGLKMYVFYVVIGLMDLVLDFRKRGMKNVG